MQSHPNRRSHDANNAPPVNAAAWGPSPHQLFFAVLSLPQTPPVGSVAARDPFSAAQALRRSLVAHASPPGSPPAVARSPPRRESEAPPTTTVAGIAIPAKLGPMRRREKGGGTAVEWNETREDRMETGYTRTRTGRELVGENRILGGTAPLRFNCPKVVIRTHYWPAPFPQRS